MTWGRCGIWVFSLSLEEGKSVRRGGIEVFGLKTRVIWVPFRVGFWFSQF